MNNTQKAEEYAAKIIESNHSKLMESVSVSEALVNAHDLLTNAVLYGIELGKQEVEQPTPPIQQGKTTEL